MCDLNTYTYILVALVLLCCIQPAHFFIISVFWIKNLFNMDSQTHRATCDYVYVYNLMSGEDTTLPK